MRRSKAAQAAPVSLPVAIADRHLKSAATHIMQAHATLAAALGESEASAIVAKLLPAAIIVARAKLREHAGGEG